MRIGISGAQGVGKSTIFEALHATGILKEHVWLPSPIRDIAKRYNLKINEQGDGLSQILIMDHLALNAFMCPDLVSDRTPLDSVVYTRLLWEHDRVSLEVWERVYSIFQVSQRLYDLTFYLEPEFPIASREGRSPDPDFQVNFVRTARRIISESQTPIVRLYGSVDERLVRACEWILCHAEKQAYYLK